MNEKKILKLGFYKTTLILPSKILNKGLYCIIVWYGQFDVQNLAQLEGRVFFEVYQGLKKKTTREIPGVLNPNISLITSYRKILKFYNMDNV